MPEGMFLRSGPDWHLDAAGVHTFEAFLEEREVAAADVDPVPIGTFLDYAAWFREQKKVLVRDRVVTRLVLGDSGFVASLDDGATVTADRVVAAAGAYYFRSYPEWADTLPPGAGVHTGDLVRFDELAGKRVLIVGGRQSAYEWAALLGEHGARRVDVVHRHDVPRFERVSWAFVNEYMDATIRTRGWWRSLSEGERQSIGRQFWEVGRLTLEWWLTPRLASGPIHRWPGSFVVDARASDGGVAVTLSGGDRIEADLVVFASGYQADLRRVPYLHDVMAGIELSDGSPVLDEGFQSSVPGLYVPGFASTRDFGPFFGFTKGCPAAASLIVDDLLRGA
jgi:cation diffusion facilitator CzcD-associated flavoprotein CzcO